MLLALHWLARNQGRAITRLTPAPEADPPPEAMGQLRRARTILFGVTARRPAIETLPEDLGLPCERWLWRDAGQPAIPVWYLPPIRARGTGPDRIAYLFHSFGRAKDRFLGRAAVLRALGCGVLLPDFPGHGDGPGDRCSLGWHEAEVVRRTLRRGAGIFTNTPAILYGSSMGGAAVLRALALEAEERERIPPIPPFPSVSRTPRLPPPPWPIQAVVLEGVYDSLVGTLRNRLASFGLPPWGLAELQAGWIGRVADFPGRALAPIRDARAVSVPSLLLQAGDDLRVTRAQALALGAALGGPTRLAIIPAAGHDMSWETDSAAWEAVIARFLDDLGPLDDQDHQPPAPRRRAGALPEGVLHA